MKILHIDKNHPVLIEGLESSGHENIKLFLESKSEILKIIASPNRHKPNPQSIRPIIEYINHFFLIDFICLKIKIFD